MIYHKINWVLMASVYFENNLLFQFLISPICC